MEALNMSDLTESESAWDRGNLIYRNLALNIWRVFRLGRKRQVQLEDLDPANKGDRACALGHRMWPHYRKPGRSFQVALLSCFRWQIFKASIMFFLYTVAVGSARIILIGQIVSDLGTRNKNNATILAHSSYSSPTVSGGQEAAIDDDETKVKRIVCSTFFYLLISFIARPIISLRTLWSDHSGLQCRVAASQLIYEKSIKLNQQALASSDVGQIVNLLSNDVARLESIVGAASSLLIIPMYVVVTLVILVLILGVYPMLACCATIFGYILLQSFLSKKFAIYRARVAACTDTRVRLIHEYLLSIEAVKMNTWQTQVERNIEQVRRKEMTLIGVSRIFRTFFGGIMLSGIILFTLVTMVVKVQLDGFPEPAILYMALELIRGLRACLGVFLPEALSSYADFSAACGRIDAFMQRPETQSQPSTILASESSCLPGMNSRSAEGISLDLNNITASWPNGNNGNVGSPILRDLSLTVRQGHLLMLAGRVGSGKTSLLLALLGELPLTSGRIQVHGRVSYAPQEAWIFPGSLRQNILFGSQLDEQRYSQVVQACALERDLELLPDGDASELGERGVSLSGGQRARVNLARALYRQADLYLLDDPLSAVDVPVAKHIFREAIQGYLRDKTVVLATHQVQFLNYVDQVLVVDRSLEPVSGTPSELSKSKQLESMGFDLKTFNLTTKQHSDSQSEAKAGRPPVAMQIVESPQTKFTPASGGEPASRRSPFIFYLANAMNLPGSIILVLLIAISELLLQGFDYFLILWADLSKSRATGSSVNINFLYKFSTNELTAILCCLTGLAFVGANLRVGAFYRAAHRASKRLHRKLVHSVVWSPMKFFDTNSIGAMINWFSRDMGYLDEFVPLIMSDLFVISIANLLGSIVVTTIIKPTYNLPLNLLMVVSVYPIYRFVTITGVRLRTLDNETKSPIYSHLSSSIAGLPAIRAFGAQQLCLRQFSDFQDTNSRASFAYLCAVSLFGDILFIPIFVFVSIETILAILDCLERKEAGLIGLLLVRTLLLQLATQWCGRYLLHLDGHMASVERVDKYSHLEAEPSDGDDNKMVQAGNLEFRQVSLYYVAGEAPILRNLSFTIEAGERVGIVGRTGAGKSSIIAVLMRLYAFEGSVLIDANDTQQMRLNHLRRSISVIAQNPVLFAGSLRSNLDPTNEHQDGQLEAALDAVKLQGQFGLEFELQVSGNNLSVGQRQLVCLARAILRKSKILVLDEATASTDNDTDALIQRLVAQQFAGSTLLIVAHRLQTVIDSDRVLVLDAGQVREFAPPWQLAADKQSLFSQMIDSGQPEQVKVMRKRLAQKKANHKLNK